MNLLITAAAHVAKLFNKRPVDFNRAVVSITYRGLLKGYSWRNIMFLGKQIAKETGYGDSRSIQEDKNAWGMNCVHVRETTQVSCRTTSSGEVLGQYRSIDSSCLDRLIWDNYWGFDSHKRDDSYPEQVGTKYHTNPGYIGSVESYPDSDVRAAMLTAVFMIPLELLLAMKAIEFLKK